MSEKIENIHWCKIYEIEGYQVLVKKEDYDHEREEFAVSITCQTKSGAQISMKLSHEEADELQIMFDGCDERMATNFVKDYVSILEGK